MCACITACPASDPLLLSTLYPVAPTTGRRCFVSIGNSPMHADSASGGARSIVSTCARGMIRQCPSCAGDMSKNATHDAFSCRMKAGAVLAATPQKMQLDDAAAAAISDFLRSRHSHNHVLVAMS